MYAIKIENKNTIKNFAAPVLSCSSCDRSLRKCRFVFLLGVFLFVIFFFVIVGVLHGPSFQRAAAYRARPAVASSHMGEEACLWGKEELRREKKNQQFVRKLIRLCTVNFLVLQRLCEKINVKNVKPSQNSAAITEMDVEKMNCITAGLCFCLEKRIPKSQ